MYDSRSPDLPALFALLAASPLRYVVSGSVAAHLHGVEVPIPGDLDIVPAMDRDNLVALRDLILDLEGHPVSLGHWTTRDNGERKWIEDTRDPAALAAWRPDPDDPASFDNLLHTRLGNFDPVPALTGTYQELAATSVTRNAWGREVRVASVEMLLSKLTVPRRDKDIDRVRALREVQRQRAGGGMPLLAAATAHEPGPPRRRIQFSADHLVDQIVAGAKTASVVALGDVDLEEDLYNSPLVVGELYDVYASDRRPRTTIRIVAMELCRWDAIPQRLWRGETNHSAEEFRRDHVGYFREPGPDYEFVAYYFEKVDP